MRIRLTISAACIAVPLVIASAHAQRGAPADAPASPRTAPAQEQRERIREREAEPLYKKALALAEDKAASPTAVLDAIDAALAAGACATRALTEAAFARFHTAPRFRDLIRRHSHQSSISMLLPGEPGELLRVSGVVRGPDGSPVPAALVYAFHTDASGRYSRTESGERNPRLYGYMRTDAAGRFAFKTIRPGQYPEQDEVEQHIHGEVSAAGYKTKTIRVNFADDPHWARHNRQPPASALPMRRGDDGASECELEIRLERE
jgi:protocatechuate 3,4-dioxygenase beta subunit